MKIRNKDMSLLELRELIIAAGGCNGIKVVNEPKFYVEVR